MDGTRIMDDDDIRAYAETRLFGDGTDPRDVRTIAQHNGTLPSALADELSRDHGRAFSPIAQENRREPIYLAPDGTLHIPQYSGFGRAFRYKTMIAAYNATLDRPKEHRELDLDGDPRRTNIAYDNYAYDFVKGIFHARDRPPIEDVTAVIIGPTAAVGRRARTAIDVGDQYLDARIIETGGRIALNIGYLYADQAGILLEKLLREREATARSHGRKEHITIYMFGRVGGLEEGMRRGDLVFPTGVIDEIDLRRGTPFVYPMHNLLAPDEPAINLNTRSVVLETKELLTAAKGYGCVCTEMEAREAVESINRARRRYADTLTVSFGFAGHVSDRPLVPGDTLARELENDAGEQAAVATILNHIAQHGGRR